MQVEDERRHADQYKEQVGGRTGLLRPVSQKRQIKINPSWEQKGLSKKRFMKGSKETYFDDHRIPDRFGLKGP